MYNITLWNQKDLAQPPVSSYKALTQDLDLVKLRNALQEGIKHFKDELLKNEAAILSRTMYRMKTKFRTFKHMKLLDKFNRCLNIYFSSNIGRHLKNILHMIPKEYQEDTYLPTKNMLYFILVKLQGLAKLMETIYDTSLIVAVELNKTIDIGHFWKLYFILFAIVSRISVLVKFNAKFLCELYGKLLPHSYKLQNTGKNWLPEGYDLPIDLRSWLSVRWVYEEEFVDLTYESTNEIINFFNLVDDDDDDVLFCDEYILLDDEDKQIVDDFRQLSPIKETLTRNRMRGFSIDEDDIGEEIDDIIDLNVSMENTEDVSGCIPNSSNKTIHMEDIGEEICVPYANGTSQHTSVENLTNKHTRRKNEINSSDFNYIIDDVSEIKENSCTLSEEDNGSDIIVLDDSINTVPSVSNINNKIGKKKRETVKNKSLKKNMDMVNQTINLGKCNQKNRVVLTKRKIEFNEIIPYKKVRKLEQAGLKLNQISLNSMAKDNLINVDMNITNLDDNGLPSEVILKKGQKRKRDKSAERLEAKFTKKSSDESIIFLDQDLSQSESKIMDMEGVSVPSENMPKKKGKPGKRKRKKKQLLKKEKASQLNQDISKHCSDNDASLIFLDQYVPSETPVANEVNAVSQKKSFQPNGIVPDSAQKPKSVKKRKRKGKKAK